MDANTPGLFDSSSYAHTRTHTRTHTYTHAHIHINDVCPIPFPVDCTNRERLGYGGDAHSRMEFAMDSYSSHALFSKWLLDWSDTSGEAIDNGPPGTDLAQRS